jgi:hypothetical protein
MCQFLDQCNKIKKDKIKIKLMFILKVVVILKNTSLFQEFPQRDALQKLDSM